MKTIEIQFDINDIVYRAEWKGTDMEKYLRPETLFGSKFENYLNAPVSQRKTYGANGIAIDRNAPDDLVDIF